MLFLYKKNNEKEELLEADIKMIGYFVPKIHIQPNSNSGYLNFDLDKAEIEVDKISKKKYSIVYKKGLISFVNSRFGTATSQQKEPYK